MKWQNKLNKDELKHVKEFAGENLSGFKINRQAQINMMDDWKKKHGSEGVEPCFECKRIAQKLGIQ